MSFAMHGIGSWIGLIIDIAVAYWVYQDAGKRGMHQIGWALGSFICFPIVTIIYLIMRKPATS
jgi:hypothetical protein